MHYSGLVWSVCIIVCVVANLIAFWTPTERNVCRTLFDYIYINDNDDCWYNPDVNSSVEEIARRYGYHIEKHYVTSEDGYVLQVYRFPPKNNTLGQPLLLKPGMGGAPEIFVMQGRKSIVFHLSDNGYDVWLSAVRGSIMIDKEERFSKSDGKYWDFTFHEMGIYDLPALTDYILQTTRSDNKIIYIGHSMSTAASYIYAMERKVHAEKNLKGIISLAPIAYMRKIKGFFKFIGPKHGFVWAVTKMMSWYVFGQHPTYRKMVRWFCGQYPGVYACYYFYGYSSGFAPAEETGEMVPMFFNTMPTPISMKTLAHLGQLIETGRFQKFDYGDDKINLEKYESVVPPEYGVNNISLPVHMFIAKYDYNSPEEDADLLYQQLKKNGVHTSKRTFEFAHSDFFLRKEYLNEFHEALLEALHDIS